MSELGSLVAGNQAAQGAKKAASLQQSQFAQTKALLQPWTTAGASVLPDLTSLATSGPFGGGPDYVTQAAGLAPGPMTEANLVQTPGYQFTLGQGLQAIQASAAARGLGVSGTAMKGAATYATGLADQTYQQQFNLQQQRFQNALALNQQQQGNLQNQYQRLYGTAGLGLNAAANTGQFGTQAAAIGGNYLAQVGQDIGGGILGAANAFNQNQQNMMSMNALQGMGTMPMLAG